MKGENNKMQITLNTVNDNGYICLSNNYSSNLIAYLCNDPVHLALEIVVIKRVSATGHQGVERNPQREHVCLQKMAATCTGRPSFAQEYFISCFTYDELVHGDFFSQRGIIISISTSCQTGK